MLRSATLIALVTFLVFLVAWRVITPSIPPQFPQFTEHRIAGPGTYDIPQWSPDGRYLAFVDSSRDATLVVYDTETEASWAVAHHVDTAHFSWAPKGDLTYLDYRADLSGSPYPIILDLHRVDLKGENDKIIAPNLSHAGDFAWFNDEERIAILLTQPDSRSFCHDVYLLNVVTGTTDFLLQAQDVDLQCIWQLALSPDDRSMLVYGAHDDNGQVEAQLVIYNLETQTLHQRIIPSRIIPSANIDYPPAGIGDDSNMGWVGGQRWILAKTITPGGECYNYALFFFDTHDLQNSFCIPGMDGPFGAPTISPDLSKISYITAVGPGEFYVILGNVTVELLDRLEIRSE